jgi:membrane protease YdiL (CAAX protease family)
MTIKTIFRALLGAAVMALALGTAAAAGQAAHVWFGLDGTARQALTATVCAGLAVSLIFALRRGVDHRPMSALGLSTPPKTRRTSTKARDGERPPPPGRPRSHGRGFVLGVVVTGGSAAVTLGLGTTVGWLDWSALDPARLAEFIVLNGIIAFGLEAFPEELVFRGYVYRTLNQALRRWTAFLLTVLLFTFAGAGASVVHSVVGTLLRLDVPSPAFAPAGEDPIVYAVMYPVFGVTLLLARITTGSLWTSVAVHLTYLTVVRVALDGAARGAGWSARWSSPDALLLVPGFLVLAALIFVALGHRIGWRERAPEPQAVRRVPR